MNFNTVEFLFVFLPLTLLAFYTVGPRYRLWVLAIASTIFYGVSGWAPLAGMVFCIAWAYLTSFVVARNPHSRLVLVVAIGPPLLGLFLFKYLGFTLDSIGAGEATRDSLFFILGLALPAGISFYTFKVVAYSIDIRDKKIPPEPSFLQLYSFFSFFPPLIAGPILRYAQLRDQLSFVATSPMLKPDFVRGLKFIAVGLFAKIVIADLPYAFTPWQGLSVIYDVKTNHSSLDALTRLFTYSFQIYYDFWAYSLMAIGIGRLFSIEIPKNFLEPYLSPNPREFWRRWHVTLSFWIRDYVYLRLGGNESYVRNIIITFLLVGLWHGAGWNFVVWGAYHAVLVVGYRLARPAWDRMPGAAQIALNFVLVSFGWPLFFLSLADYVAMMQTIFSFNFAYTGQYGVPFYVYLAAVGAWTFATRERQWLFNEDRTHLLDWPVVHAGLIVASVMLIDFGRTFIYFRF